MSGDLGRPGPSRTLARARERAADGLTRAFAEDELDVDEFEARLDRCWRARSFDELETLFEDLAVACPARRPERGVRGGDAGETRGTGAPSGSSAPARSSAGAHRRPVPTERPGHDLVMAVMSGVGRGGRWTPPRHINAVAVMGGVELDFRDARFPEGETTVNAVALMGGVEIVVPPGLAVTCSGVPILGGFERLDQEDDGTRAPGAVLRIRGLACMGGVEVRAAGTDEAASPGGVAELD